MEYSIKSAPIRTVIGETKIEANISGGSISTTIGEGARMNVSQATVNVESGKAEIEKAVNQGKTVISGHTTEKIGEFDSNAVDKTQDFNDNASDKTQDFNDNYVDKKALIDAEVSTAQNAAAEAKQWAIGDPTEPTGNSAKYWAEEAATTLANKQDKLTVGTGIDITSNVISVTSPALINTATGSNSVAVATPSSVSANNAVAVGYNSYVSGYMGTAIGAYAKSTSSNAIQLGYGTNGEANSLYVGTSTSNNYKMLDDTGLIPDARISSNIARTSAIPTSVDDLSDVTVSGATNGQALIYNSVSQKWENSAIPGVTVDQVYDGTSANAQSGVAIAGAGFLTGITSGDVTTALGYTPVNPSSLASVATSGLYSDLSGTPTVDQTYDGTSTNAQSGTAIAGLLEAIYPVGSVYIGTQSTCPMSTVMSGTTWTLVSSGKALWTGNGTNGNTTIAAGLPNITGKVTPRPLNSASGAGAITSANGAFSLSQKTGGATSSMSITSTNYGSDVLTFDASSSSSIYGNSTTVQPPAYVVNVWRRTA